MRTRFDQFGKQMVSAALEPHGNVETEAEVSAETRRIDLWFVPHRSPTGATHHLGLLGRIASGPSTLEFFHDTPDGDKLAGCLIKHGEFRHNLSLRKAPPRTPTQWVISAGRPDGGIAGLWLPPMRTWMKGFYEGPPLLWTRLVVVNELPISRDTLLVRLLGAGPVLEQALTELQDLPVDAPERTLALPVLVRLTLTVPSDPVKQTKDDQEFLLQTQDIVENWRRDAIQEGIQKGRKEALVAFYEARFGEMPAELRAVIDAIEDDETLEAWIRLAGTRGADEIAAVIRASRVS
jgi:hypothetical protein